MRTNEEVGARIEALRAEAGEELVILGHHYQRSAVLRHADAIGDSLGLARQAAERRQARRIVFCGVKFMAESADVLSGPNQTVYMPEVLAGCPMANMADAAQAEAAMARLSAEVPDAWTPVVYVNSTAAVKAFCGRHGGSACTSSNAARVFEWALSKSGRRILFLPDEHLGVNTAHDLGIAEQAVAVYDPALPDGGLDAQTVRAARVVVWKGFFIDYVAAAPAGARIVVGTELNLVDRLADQYRGEKTVQALRPSVCANMARTDERNLLALLEDWPDENVVRVDRETAGDACRALETMLALR